MKFFSLFLYILFLTIGLNAQSLSIKYLGIENGLSNNAVNTIYQDHNGFMWFGTYDGLNRYDGYSFKVFRNVIGDSTSISSNSVNAITEDARHNIWLGGQKDISIYNPVTAKFSTPQYILGNKVVKRSIADNVLALKTIDSKTILAGTQHNGLFYFTNSATGTQVPLTLNGNTTYNYYVSAIEFDKKQNNAYVFIQEHGLYKYDNSKHTLILVNNTIRIVNCLIADSKSRLWLGTNNGLFYYDYKSNSISANVAPAIPPIVNVCEDKKEKIWIASDGGGLWLLEDGKNMAVSLASLSANGKSPVNSNAVYAVYVDNDNRKWIGTLRGGVNIIEPETNFFKPIVYKPESNISTVENFILSFAEDADKNIWIGTDGAGLRYWNRKDNTFRNYTHINNDNSTVGSNFITGILKDNNNNIWVSTWRGGISKFNKQANNFKHYDCIAPETNTTDNNIWFLFEDSKHNIWAGAVRNGGLYKLNKEKDVFECFDKKLPELQSIAEDAEGNIWCGNYSSLIKIDQAKKQHVVYNIGYTVRSIHEDAFKNLWLGTQEGGLLLFNKNNGSFKRYTTAEGLPNNTVLRILEDKKHNLWLSTYNGLSSFNIKAQAFRNFSQSDGLQSNQFSYNAAIATSNGEFLFGGIKGFNIFYPDSIQSIKKNPKLFLTALKISNTPVERNEEYVKERNLEEIKQITIPYNKATLSLEFLGLDYADATDLKYAYNLKGWDKDWNYVNSTRTANYSRLQEGDYVFEVKASNSSGVWGTSQQLLHITVLPPWHRTWWAYCIYILGIVGAIYLYTLYKNRQTKLQYEVQLAHLETQKEKELNEKKIAFFTNVSHEFRTPLSLIINPVKTLLHKTEDRAESAELKVIYRNAQRLLRLVDQLLLFKKAEAETDKINAVALNFYNLCVDVFACFTEQARSKKIAYNLICDNAFKDILIRGDREKLEIVLFNILSNAFKYTPDGGTITFTATEKDEQVIINISDSGSGIPAEEGQKLFERFYQVKKDSAKSGFGIGLYLVKTFIEAHNGSVTYTSEPNKGTTFTISLNKNNHGLSLPATTQPAEIVIAPETTTNENVSSLISELNEPVLATEDAEESNIPQKIASDKQTLLIIDDDDEIRNYLVNIFATQYKIYNTNNAEKGIELARKQLPDLIISDVVMKGLNGLDLCRTLKEDSTVSHIPIILLTGSSSDEMQLKGMESGADDFIKKPFNNEILIARVQSILKRRNVLQNYFFNEITLGSGKFKISAEYKDFLEKCMLIIEDHLEDDQFSIKVLAAEIGMSHSNLYKKIKTVSGQSVNGFIRFIRLKKAAEILINSEHNVNETANLVGFYDVKYFRTQFVKLFGVTPSEYIKKFRTSFRQTQNLEDKIRK